MPRSKSSRKRSAAQAQELRSRLTLAEQYDRTLVAERKRSPSPAVAASVSREQFKPVTSIVAMDCEYVGVGYLGKEDQLARVSILDVSGQCIYDEYVKPLEKVVDYRTAISGVRAGHLRNGKDFALVQEQVRQVLANKVLVGHGLSNDLRVLGLTHPTGLIRDTAYYKPLREMVINREGDSGKKRSSSRPPKLKVLAYHMLGVQIQQGEHDSVSDARVALRIYLLHQRRWEKDFQRYQDQNVYRF